MINHQISALNISTLLKSNYQTFLTFWEQTGLGLGLDKDFLYVFMNLIFTSMPLPPTRYTLYPSLSIVESWIHPEGTQTMWIAIEILDHKSANWRPLFTNKRSGTALRLWNDNRAAVMAPQIMGVGNRLGVPLPFNASLYSHIEINRSMVSTHLSILQFCVFSKSVTQLSLYMTSLNL